MKKSERKYYNISSPTEKNSRTGNVCVSISDVTKFDKDFLFNQEVDDIHYEIILPKEWIIKHMRMFIKKHRYENPKDDKFSYFYMLKISDILNYYEQNKYK